MRPGPGNRHGTDAARRALHAWQAGVQIRLILTGVPVTPDAGFEMVIDGYRLMTLGTRKPVRPRLMFQVHIHDERGLVYHDRFDKPRRLYTEYLFVEFSCFHTLFIPYPYKSR